MKFVNDGTKKIFLLTNGCPENRIDSYKINEFFKKNKWPIASDLPDADIILFNACGQSCQKSFPILNELQNNKKNSAEVIVFGCLPKININELKKVYQGPYFGSDELDKLDEIFSSNIKQNDITGNFLIPQSSLSYKARVVNLNIINEPIEIFRLFLRKISSTKYNSIRNNINVFGDDIFNIKISTGCSSKCSYCSIRFARGNLISKPVDKIKNELRNGLSSGYKKIGLIGTEIANYGADLGVNLPYLLREIIKIDKDFSIKLRNLNPYYFLHYYQELLDIFKSGRITYLETAAQSGSNRILELMKRGYTVEEYKKAIKGFRKEINGIEIRTQVMVNFPSETEEEAQDTLNMLKELKFNFIELYDFRAEPFTQASRMEQIPKKIARRRYHKMYMEILKLIR